MIWKLILGNWKPVSIGVFLIVMIGGGYLLFKQNRELKKENNRLIENAESIRFEKKNDSVTYSEVILTQKEFLEDMQHNHKEQLERIEKTLNINAKQIKRLQTSKTVYITKDTTSYVLDRILKAIQNNEPVTQKVVDSTKCHLVEANIHFNGKDLRLDVTKVGYTNITEIVAFLEKKKWGWLPWNWFKKRKVSVSVLNSCGVTETRLVDVIRK